MATLSPNLRLENSNHLSSWLAPILILGVSIFDMTLVTISRSRRGLLTFAAPGKGHAAHRLSNLGLGRRGAILKLYLLGAVSGAPAVLVAYLSAWMVFLVGAVALGIILAGVVYLERAPYERQTRNASTAT
jgi:UDP-GlcNAc:undecaprenyl-phosphate GlcNAc-1-phosphate transferase